MDQELVLKRLSEPAHRLADLVRISMPATKLLGPEYMTSLDNIEIDITFKCNLKCYNCDRSCTQAPDDSRMTVEQIKKFIGESVNNNKHWSRIRILGGEPTIHPDIDDIINILLDYKEKYSLSSRIELTTNNYGPEVNRKLLKMPRKIYVNDTHKTGRFQKKFVAFNLAPCDYNIYSFSDYTNACWITKDCGIGLNRYGYYHCGVGGSIDRVFGFDIGLKKMPQNTSEFRKQKIKLCKLCGHFLCRKYIHPEQRVPIEGEPKSKTWISAYNLYPSSSILTKY